VSRVGLLCSFLRPFLILLPRGWVCFSVPSPPFLVSTLRCCRTLLFDRGCDPPALFSLSIVLSNFRLLYLVPVFSLLRPHPPALGLVAIEAKLRKFEQFGDEI
jgi:hypothetical protein